MQSGKTEQLKYNKKLQKPFQTTEAISPVTLCISDRTNQNVAGGILSVTQQLVTLTSCLPSLNLERLADVQKTKSHPYKHGIVSISPPTSLYLKISCMLIPSVFRTVSFSPVFVVVSLSRQRVRPLVSMMTAFWASDVSTEVRSKCTLLTGNARSTYKGDR